MAGATSGELAGGVGGPTAHAAPVMPSPEEIAQLAAAARQPCPCSNTMSRGTTQHHCF